MAGHDSSKLIQRFEMIAPLLNGNIDAFERRRLRAQILESSGISERTLRRYIQHYKEKGYTGLADIQRSDKGMLRAVPKEAVDEAIRLRQELPSRSVRRIIEVLEGEKIVKPCEVSRTSLNRHLVQRGYGAAQLKAEGKSTPPAVDAAFNFSGGVARKINKVCSMSLLYAAQKAMHTIDGGIVEYVAEQELSW